MNLPPINKRTPSVMLQLGFVECPVCKGRGSYRRTLCGANVQCIFCKGEGWVIEKKK